MKGFLFLAYTMAFLTGVQPAFLFLFYMSISWLVCGGVLFDTPLEVH
jgi:hypothetical protein